MWSDDDDSGKRDRIERGDADTIEIVDKSQTRENRPRRQLTIERVQQQREDRMGWDGMGWRLDQLAGDG